MAMNVVESLQPWQWMSPVADGASLVTLAPDRTEILRIDRATGATLGRRAAGALGDPAYLLRVGTMLAAVSRDAVTFVPIAEFESGTPHRSKPVAPFILGRAVPAGGSLIIPRTDGVAMLDPEKPSVEAPVVALEKPGNVLPLESQLLVLDARQLHSYLTWSVAERLLEDRMKADPGDADPAITYAELAYRAGHPERIPTAADRALAAIEKGGASESARLARRRLFTVLRDMAEYTEGRWDSDKSAPAKEPPAPAARPRGPVLVKKVPTELPVLEQAALAEVVDRMGRAAQTPDEQVSHLMVLGRLREAEGKPALAAESYQRILTEAPLSKASWRGPSVSVRAELEATRRVRQLVLDRGAAAYGPFDAQASRELAALGDNADTEALERLARQYPGAAVSGPAWMRAAEQHERAGRAHAAVADLREGLAAAETAYGAGSMRDPTPLGEISGRLVNRLKALDQLFASAQLLSRLRTQYPELTLTDRGATIDSTALSAELVQRLASLQRLPRIGPDIRADAQPIAGWSIMLPRSRRASASPEHLMLISPSQAQVGLWGLAGGVSGDAAGRVQMLWSRSYSGQPPILLRIDPESVYLLWENSEAGDGPTIERIAAVTGETTWKTEPFRGLFPADPAFDKRAEQLRSIDTPIDGSVHLTDILVAIDEQAIAIVERSGRAAAFDPANGKMLWRSATAITNVHDIDACDGAIAIGGAAAPANDPGALVGLTPLALALDARTGQVMHRYDELANQQVRWVRLAGVGDQAPMLVLGLEAQVQSFDLAHGNTNWTIAGGPAFRSMDAWILAERLFLLAEPPQGNAQSRTLYMAPLASGRLGDRPLDTYEQLGGGPIYATRVGPKRDMVAFSTTRGVCIFDNKGELAGLDALEAGDGDEGGLVPPVASDGYFVTADTMPRQGEHGQNVYTIHLLDTQSAALKANRTISLELPPKRMAVLDGKILITAGANTIVYSAPISDSK
jgi:hypothetical protein